MKNKLVIFPREFGVLPYIFLTYLALPVLSNLQETGVKSLIGYGLIIVFAISYRQLYCMIGKSSRHYSYWLAAQILIVFILSVAFNPNNVFMGFFPAHFIGWYQKPKSFYKALVSFAAVMVSILVISAFQGQLDNLLFLLPFFLVMISSPFGIRSLNKQIQLEKELDEANEKIKMLVKQEERVRIARDLHDTLGHTLSLITLQSQLVQRLIDKQPERAKLETKEIEVSSRSALQQVRELVSDMRANTIADELNDMEQILTAAGISFEVELDMDVSQVPPLQQNIIGMCLREAVTNIVKHSEATHCLVVVSKSTGQIRMVVKDDGRGFNPGIREGNGLKGMRERLNLVDGKLSIDSIGGTELTMHLPIVMKQEKVGTA